MAPSQISNHSQCTWSCPVSTPHDMPRPPPCCSPFESGSGVRGHSSHNKTARSRYPRVDSPRRCKPSCAKTRSPGRSAVHPAPTEASFHLHARTTKAASNRRPRRDRNRLERFLQHSAAGRNRGRSWCFPPKTSRCMTQALGRCMQSTAAAAPGPRQRRPAPPSTETEAGRHRRRSVVSPRRAASGSDRPHRRQTSAWSAEGSTSVSWFRVMFVISFGCFCGDAVSV
jgi:hypothetical protein